MRHVITLSTIPPRFAALGTALKALVAQSSRPEAVELWIPRYYRRFPGYGGELPEVPEGVTIRRCDVDFGPATKVLPAAQDRQGHAVDLIFCDDDQLYRRDWAARLLAVRARRPADAVAAGGTTVQRMGRPGGQPREPHAVCSVQPGDQLVFSWWRRLQTLRYRGRGNIPLQAPFRMIDRAGYLDIAEGYGGIVVRPDFFDAPVYDIPPVLWSVDDVWLSGHLERRGIGIWAEPGLNLRRSLHQVAREEPLYSTLAEGKGRREANRLCVEYFQTTYGIWGGVAHQSS